MKYLLLFFLCLIGGVTVAAAVMWTATWDIDRWIAPAFQTTLLFVVLIVDDRAHWRRTLFWTCIMVAAVLHVAATACAVSVPGESTRTFWWFAAVLPEFVAIEEVFARLGFRSTNTRRR